MPTSSSLVTNLPADFNTFGQGVDTSLQDLLGGTTGQVLSKTSGTNMDFTWVTPTDQTPLTTKGDLFTFSTVDARLPVGTNNQILVADSAQATGLKWATPAASGLTFITGATFTSVASVSLPNSTFTATYDNYRIIFNITAASGAITKTSFRFRASGTDNTTAAYYAGSAGVTYTGATSNTNTNGGTLIDWGGMNTGTGSINSESNQFEIVMMSPYLTQHTVFTAFGGVGSWTMRALTGIFNGTTSFDSFTLLGDAGTISGKYRVYGIANS